MSAKHTPGPWGIDWQNCYVHAPGMPIVAETWNMTGARWVEGQANARLIAAAPENYEANRLSLRNVESLIDRLSVSAAETEWKSLEKWREALRAAIAKAEGGK